MNHRLFDEQPHSTRTVPRLLRAIEEARGIILSPDPPRQEDLEYNDLSKFLPYKEQNEMKILPTIDPSPWYQKWKEVSYRKWSESHDPMNDDITMQPVENNHHTFQVTTQTSELSHPSNSYSFKVSGLDPDTKYIIGLRFNAEPKEAYTFHHEMGALVPYDMVHPDYLSSMEVRMRLQYGGDLENGSIDFGGLRFGGCYSALKNSKDSNVILLSMHRKWTPIITLYTEESEVIREFQFHEMEFISKFPYHQYQVFARSRENLEEDNRKYKEEKFRRLVIDIRELERLSKIVAQWEKVQEQPECPGQPFHMFPKPREDGTIIISIGNYVYNFEDKKEFFLKIRKYRLFVTEESMKKKIESETRGQRENPEEDYTEDEVSEEEEEEYDVPRKRRGKSEKRKTSQKQSGRRKKRKCSIQREEPSIAFVDWNERRKREKIKEDDELNAMWDSIRRGSTGEESEQWSSTNSTRSSVSPVS
ncbi:hypothetical protein GCK72_011834 [Caenorhabditis remanei]|uniref:T-box domain-containing protein n=1 Tax=Caenorhabditis remanei TaxID=31234 RepID=A0A6A5H760_CAERE|nr:hypothetical protein GCK72_011834 [Caenorhabditis remanei]KAF1763568.1 hypothetical protein GCK72_011834 [Caenorhabditis remanei]